MYTDLGPRRFQSECLEKSVTQRFSALHLQMPSDRQKQYKKANETQFQNGYSVPFFGTFFCGGCCKYQSNVGIERPPNHKSYEQIYRIKNYINLSFVCIENRNTFRKIISRQSRLIYAVQRVRVCLWWHVLLCRGSAVCCNGISCEDVIVFAWKLCWRVH